MPLNYSGSKSPGLDRFSWANIPFNETGLYWVHLTVALVVIVFILHTLYTELIFYVHVRNSYLRAPAHRHLEVAKTILVTNIPGEYLSVLEDMYSIFPGGVHFVWVHRDFSVLLEKLQERKKIIVTLEAEETRLIRLSVTSSLQRRKPELGNEWKKPVDGEIGLWKLYLDKKDRSQMYLPIRGWTWMPAIPLLEKKLTLSIIAWRG